MLVQLPSEVSDASIFRSQDIKRRTHMFIKEIRIFLSDSFELCIYI